MRVDTKFLQFLLDCINNKKSNEVVDTAMETLRGVIRDSKDESENELLLNILICMENDLICEEREHITKELESIISNRTLEESDRCKIKYSSVGFGATNIS